jgi:hypothetical protein
MPSEIDTTYSDLVLMVGGQLLILFLIAMITVFGVKPLSDPLRTLSTVASVASVASVAASPSKQNK